MAMRRCAPLQPVPACRPRPRPAHWPMPVTNSVSTLRNSALAEFADSVIARFMPQLDEKDDAGVLRDVSLIAYEHTA